MILDDLVGKQFVIIGNSVLHGFENGDIVTYLEAISQKSPHCFRASGNSRFNWWVSWRDVKPVVSLTVEELLGV